MSKFPTNFRPLQKHWSPKWAIAKRPFSKSQQHHLKHQTTNSAKPNQTAKGKLNKFKRKWRWGAGAGWTILSVLDWWLLAAGGWFTGTTGIVLRWTPLGLVLIAAAEWHLHNRECERKGLPRTATQWQVNQILNAKPSSRFKICFFLLSSFIKTK